MKKYTKIICLFAMLTFIAVVAMNLTGCSVPVYEDSGSKQDVLATMQTTSNLQETQPTPTDINYSLERYNLIRRAYWVNGQREKASVVICQVEKPLGYIVLFTDNGSVVGRFIVDGNIPEDIEEELETIR